ncbi:MAG: hypothetical protein ABIV47_20170, partial [Roseiflexaceae bacterium]
MSRSTSAVCLIPLSVSGASSSTRLLCVFQCSKLFASQALIDICAKRFSYESLEFRVIHIAGEHHLIRFCIMACNTPQAEPAARMPRQLKWTHTLISPLQ